MPNVILGKNFEALKIAGVGVGTLLGFIVTASIVRNNILSAKVMKGNLAKLTSEGFYTPDFLDNIFSEIQGAAVAEKNSTPATKSPAADGGSYKEMYDYTFPQARQTFMNPDIARQGAIWGNK